MQSSLAQSISRRLAVVVGVALALAATLTISYLARHQLSETADENHLAASLAKTELSWFLKSHELGVAQLAILVAEHPDDSSEVERAMRRALEEYSELESILVLDDAGVVVAARMSDSVRVSASDVVGLDRSRDPVLAPLLEGTDVRWSDAFASVVSGEPVAALVVPADGRYVVAQVRLASLEGLLITHTKHSDVRPIVTDGRGVVLLHQDPQLVAHRVNLKSVLPVASALEGRPGDYRYRWEEQSYLGSSVLVEESGWVVCVGEPASEALRPVLELAWVLVAIFAGVTAFTSFTVAVQARAVSQPLRALAKQAERIGGGDFSADSSLHRYREISFLSRSMSAMAQAIEDRERRLQESEANYRYFVESLHGVPWEYDVEADRFTWVGPQSEQIIGYPPEAWASFDAWSRFIHPEDRDRAVRYCLRETDANRPHDFQYRIVKPDGEIVWIHDIVSVRERSTGGTVLSGVLIDVTDAKMIEQSRVSVEAALAASTAKSRFLASMSHELRTPLNSIIGFSRVLSQGLAGPVTQEQRTQLDMIHRAGQHLLALVAQILDLSRIEAGKEDLVVSEFLVLDLVNEVVEMVGPLAAERGLWLRVESDSTAARATTDLGKVRQILLNLVSNALKFTQEGGVVIHMGADDGFTQSISVMDTGPGMTAQQLEQLFTEFERLGRPNEAAQSGTGLGLAISRRLAEILGGGITVRSEPDEGSVFEFEFARDVSARISTGLSPADEPDGPPVDV